MRHSSQSLRSFTTTYFVQEYLGTYVVYSDAPIRFGKMQIRICMDGQGNDLNLYGVRCDYEIFRVQQA